MSSSSSQPTNDNPAAPSTSTSQPAPSTDADTTSISALTKLSELLRFSNGNIDQAAQLATLLSRLSPALLNNLSSPSNPNPNSATDTDTAQSQSPSEQARTSTSASGISAAAAAASSAGVAVATSAPNSSATATVSPPSLLTQGSVSSSTAVPFSEVSGLPSDVCIDLGGCGAGNNTTSTVRQSEGSTVAQSGGGGGGGSGGGVTKTSSIADITQRANRALAEPLGQTRGAAANSAGSVRRS